MTTGYDPDEQSAAYLSGRGVAWADEPTAAPGVPVPPKVVPGPPATPPPAAGLSYPRPYVGPPADVPSPPQPPWPGPSGVVSPSGAPGSPGLATPVKHRLAWPGTVALLLVIVLVGVAGLQAYQINRLSHRLADTKRELSEAQAGNGARFEALEDRAAGLETQAGNVFNPEAIASAVLPSVFRVRAGDFTGTAFAVGEPVSGGGTNLFTNFHVVESVWGSGGREVFLERTGQRFPATIVKVDEENDIAQLATDATFDGLFTASTPVKSGQQIVVVGAPLGLEDTVTTGVVSAFRRMDDGSGTMIQFDAPINPGNSGGPVINGAKQVVGIATAKARDAEGIGLAVPIKTACDEFKIC